MSDPNLFDARAATDAYLAAVSPAAHLKATHYTQGGHWLLLWGWLVTVLACVIIARTRLLVRTEGALERRRGRPILASFVVAALFTALDAILELPWAVYSQWWRERGYGLTSEPLGGWLGEQVIGLLINAVVAGIFFMALYALIRRAPRRWWLWAGGLISVSVMVIMILAPVFVEPLFNHYTPAPPGPTRDAIVGLAKVAGVPSDKIYIYNGSKQSNRYTANVSGMLGTARVNMSDMMFRRGADIAEVRGVVGHEMGHYKHGHLVVAALAFGLAGLSICGIAVGAFPITDRVFRSGAASLADPAGLPTLWVIVSSLMLLATPLLNTMARLEESDADAFSLRVAHEPDGMARSLVKTIEYRADSPSSLEEAIFYDHPSVRRRIQRAMDWKAAHRPQVQGQRRDDARF